MFFKTRHRISDDNLKRLAWRLAGAFYREGFGFYDDTMTCIEAIETYQQDGDDITPEPGEYFYEIHLSGRYYGPEYERGPITDFVAIAEWLEFNVADAEVWYGGDSSGICATRFDRPARQVLLAHFYRHGHLPYVEAFDGLTEGRPECPRCKIHMIQNGGGGDREFYFCYGCPNKAITVAGKLARLWSDDRDVFSVSRELQEACK